MRIFKYLIGIWTAVLVYAFFSFLSGSKGLSAYNQLLYERDQQWENIEKLGIINEELEKNKNNLLFDNDTLMVQARQMGYGLPNERFIRIVGLGTNRTPPVVSGKLYFIKEPDYLSDKIIKIAAICAGFLIFSLLFILEFIETRVN